MHQHALHDENITWCWSQWNLFAKWDEGMQGERDSRWLVAERADRHHAQILSECMSMHLMMEPTSGAGRCLVCLLNGMSACRARETLGGWWPVAERADSNDGQIPSECSSMHLVMKPISDAYQSGMILPSGMHACRVTQGGWWLSEQMATMRKSQQNTSACISCWSPCLGSFGQHSPSRHRSS